jgi:NAD-dependent deacetylase
VKVSVLTGAGISAESGLPTFRGKGEGLWAKFNPMELATPAAFKAQPEKVHEFYNLRRRLLQEVKANAAHFSLVKLAEKLSRKGGELKIITQNVDDLHERAGSRHVLHIHGELMQVKCIACDRVVVWTADLGLRERCPTCGEVGKLRPNVVWFGEMPYGMDEAMEAVTQSDLFVAIGTSGAVYPAAGLVELAASHGARTCELNLAPSENYYVFDEAHYGLATEIVPAWVDALSG